MYLNTSLVPPTSGTSTCRTPKTPEILNSIISLTSPARSSPYDCQGSLSNASSPTDNVNSFEEYSSYACGGSPLFQYKSTPIDNSPTYDETTAKTLELPSGMGESSIGTPSPPVPELPSPVQPMEATKSALIKEGLKYQIQTKLNAAGMASPTTLAEHKSFKEELTPEDEDRRRRRRERNKVAATKCRNKKKERTSILVNESEEVEDENLKLRTEIQRLQCEKMELEKLLDDPNHIACCVHTNRVSSLSPTTCSQVQSVAGHCTVSNTIDRHTESADMSYSSLPNPSPISTAPYMHNHTDKIHMRPPDNEPYSKFSNFPLTCVSSLKCTSENEGCDNALLPITALSTTDLNAKMMFSDKPELTYTSNLTSQFSPCLQDSHVSTMAGNYTNPIMTRPILESGNLSLGFIDGDEQKNSQIKGESSVSCEPGDFFCEKQTFCEANANENLISLKTSYLPKSIHTSRYCPYERTVTMGTPVPDYAEHIMARNNFNRNLCSQNVTSSFTAECTRQLYPTCTYE